MTNNKHEFFLYMAHIESSYGGWVLAPKDYGTKNAEGLIPKILKRVWYGVYSKANLIVDSNEMLPLIVIAEIHGPAPANSKDTNGWGKPNEGSAVVAWLAKHVGDPFDEAMLHIEAAGGWDAVAEEYWT